MQLPGYPSNREADKRAIKSLPEGGKAPLRMMPSRETWLRCGERGMLLGCGIDTRGDAAQFCCFFFCKKEAFFYFLSKKGEPI